MIPGRAGEQTAEPTLDQESREVEWVVVFFKECPAILEISHKEARDGGGLPF